MREPVRSRLLTTSMLVVVHIAALVGAAETGSSEERIKVKTVVGTAEVRSGGSNTWRPVRLGMNLRTGWDIRTFVESTAELEYETGTILRVGENSVVSLSSLKKSADATSTESGVKVNTGQVWANVKKLANAKSKFEFETPTAVASIRGTRLGVGVTDGRTAIDVYEGLVMVRNKGSGKEVPVGTRNRAVIEQGQAEVGLFEFGSTSSDSSGGAQPQDPFMTDSAALDSMQQGGAADSTGTEAATDSSGVGAKTTDTTNADSTAALPGGTAISADSLAKPGLSSPLSLDITSPANKAVVTQTPVLVRGRTAPGSAIMVGNRSSSVGPDGAFTALVDLVAGSNSINVSARNADRSKSVDLSVEYHPPLTLSLSNLYDNMEVIAAELVIDIEVSEGAQYSVNGRTGVNRIVLASGRNVVAVVVWDQWGGRQERSFVVNYRKATSFELKVTSPRDGDTVRKAMIPISGSTINGASVTVNKASVPVNSGGFFSHQIPIPNERQEYVIEISARLGDQEKTETRTVVYAPLLEPMQLVLISPVQGQPVMTRVLRVAGKTGSGSTVRVNGRTAAVTPNGMFSADLPLTEREIGDFLIEVQATRGDEELSKSIAVKVDVASPQMNTTAPKLVVSGLGQQAIRTSQLSSQVYDQTPTDAITLRVQNNGITESFTLESGGRESVQLNEGKNDLVIRATDKAGNISNVVQTSVYCLPGPLSIDITEPADNPLIVTDRPPLPRRPGVPQIVPKVRFKVELDDGIGKVPETIRYCKVTSSTGQSVLLRLERPYVYIGELQLPNGTTTFTLQAEDLAGNTAVKRIETRVSE